MSATNLLNLNVDTLFEQHSVPEIDIVQKKIQEVVEKKREELRTMVGERYRDLLQAADTIAAMQDSSRTLITQVDCISVNCRNLNEQQLIGFKTGSAAEGDTTDLLRQRIANKQINQYFSTMVQIKLLTALPELIWSHLDGEHFYAATELFIFSRHISTGLQLDANNTLMQHLPVARKQWELLKPFHVTIKQRLLAVLEREVLSADVAADCLLSLLLLEKSQLNAVFQTFLQLRCTAFQRCLNDSQTTNSTGDVERQRRRVKERILASLQVLNGTIDLVAKCVLDNGLLFQKLAEHTDQHAAPTIARMDSNDTQFAYMLPEIISNFRPKFEAQHLDNTQARTVLEQWLADTKRIAGVELKQLFELVATMNTIQEIKTEACAYRRSLQHISAPIAEQLYLTTELDFYEQQYVPLINQRVRNIIQDSWTQAMSTTFEALTQAMPHTAIHEQQIWLEQASDLPQSLEQALSEDSKLKSLLMKTKGYDNEIIALCTQFDRQLASIVSEMNVLLEEQPTRSDDKVALVEFLRETAQTQLTDFIGKVKNLQWSIEQRNELLFVVRACVALVELCPHLKICFCQQSSWRQWLGNHSTHSLENWQRICCLLEDETFQFWQQIIVSILAEHPCEQHLPLAITHDVALEDFANWDTITLEQKDDQDNAINSTFRIPNQPRISLQSYLFALIRSLNIAVPQTLPHKVLKAFNNKFLTQLLQHYQTLSSSSDNESPQTVSQNVALQLYFDLKFLHSVFSVTREERTLNEQFQSLQNTLKNLIDPFDFELFAEHITTNVKRSVSRLSCELGVLTPSSAMTTTAQSTSVAHEKDPNVLSLSSCGSTSLWFPLLPIVTGAMDIKRLMQHEKQTTPTRKSTTNTTTLSSTSRKSDTNNTTATTTRSKSGAASFFGAMSQEWFR